MCFQIFAGYRNIFNIFWTLFFMENQSGSGVFSQQLPVNYRTTERIRLEGTTGRHVLQLPCSATVFLEHITQDSVQIQTVLAYLQWGRLHNLARQAVPVWSYLHSKELLPDIRVEFSWLNYNHNLSNDSLKVKKMGKKLLWISRKIVFQC